jgi:hypothetical protein
MLPLAIAGALAVALVLVRVRRRGTLRREIERRGWGYRPRDDELARTWTMPPFAHLTSPADAHLPPPLRTVRVDEVITWSVGGSVAHSMTVTVTVGADQMAPTSTHHVVALHTRQRLPRTIVRAGIDVYVLPAYDGLQRVLEPKRWTRHGVMSVLSEDPDAAAALPLDRVAADLGADGQLHLVTDGDWIYAYRSGDANLWRIDQLVVTVQKLARGIRPTRWPDQNDASSFVYGAV